MLAIKNNLMAEGAARSVGKSYDALAQSVQRLSSGLRINGAADDAAGLAVRDVMRADIAVLRQGSRNAQDGISLLQTAEGALEVVDEVLIRMKELAEQAATESYSTAQLAIMDDEFQAMMLEIDRIAAATKFNGISLIDDATATVHIHFGTSNTADDAIDVTLVNATSAADGLNVVGMTITDTTTAQASLAALDLAIVANAGNRASLGYTMNRLEHTISVLGIQTENLVVAESRISDVDMATEMTAMTRNQVLTQAGVAMLAQANAMPQMALTLLR
ncbi:MAG TPA: flagellin [Phycisphaerae bacterium]|nr:flagellin [Phycisphaerae bacterium]